MYFRHLTFAVFALALSCGCGQKSTPQPDGAKSPDGLSVGSPTIELVNDSVGESELLAEYVTYPSLGIKIRRPEGFGKADTFDGFGHAVTQSSVVAMSIPGPYDKVGAGLTGEKMKERGWTMLSRQDVRIQGLPGVFVQFEQPLGSNVFLKWSLAFGDSRKTTMITAAYPKQSAPEMSARLKFSVLSTRLVRSENLDPAADLQFTVVASKKLKATRSISRTLAFTKDGTMPAKSPDDPFLIAAPSLGTTPINDKRQFAENRLLEHVKVKKISIQSTKAIVVDDLSGFESVATGTDAKTGTPFFVYQVVLFDDDMYYVMQGVAGTQYREEFHPEFEAMARSFKMKD